MFYDGYCEHRADKTPVTQKDYKYYEQKSGSKYNRRCIDGQITGCGNCIGYCQFAEHSGFLTKEHCEAHNCIEKGCNYFIKKVKSKKLQEETCNHSRHIVELASDLISEFEGIRIMDASRKQGDGWIVNYISITNGYSIKDIEKRISTVVGETITMVNLNYSFDRAVRLIFT